MCWKLHERPPNFNNNNRGWRPNGEQQQKVQGQTNLTNINLLNDENETQTHGEFKEDLERLKRLLRSFEKPFGACSLSLSGKYSVSHAFNVLDSPLSDSWVIDSGAMDHMTDSALKFCSYSPCLSNKKISIVDGSSIAGQGKIHVNSSLTLDNVLHVPKLSTNLVSIHWIVKDMNCCVVFYPSHCVFQDQSSGKTIGLVKEKNELYYLDVLGDQNRTENKFPLSYLTKSSISKKDKIWLHHLYLGHPSFNILKVLFP